jgi:hypothetical protein
MVALVAIQETTGRILAIYCPDCCRKTFAVPAKFFNKKNSAIVVVTGNLYWQSLSPVFHNNLKCDFPSIPIFGPYLVEFMV